MYQYFLSCCQQILHPRNAFSFGHEISSEHQRLTFLPKETLDDFNLYNMTNYKAQCSRWPCCDAHDNSWQIETLTQGYNTFLFKIAQYFPRARGEGSL